MADVFGPAVGPVALDDNMIGPDIDCVLFAYMQTPDPHRAQSHCHSQRLKQPEGHEALP